MTRKDYRLIAAAIYASRETLTVAYTNDLQREIALAAVDSAAITLAQKLSLDNPRFDYYRFYSACVEGK